jgi:23S rRNA (adenine2030-N6)-methyltransferase
MLSYQHIYHAGGLADVHKHAALARMLKRIAANGPVCTYVETHAGRGLYDIHCAEQQKTREAERGILALDDGRSPLLPAPYREAIAAARAVHGRRIYPGSPVIAQILLRPTDPIYLAELHPREFKALKHEVRGRGIWVEQVDGFELAARVLPPRQGRGFLFIDPSYEIKSDYEQVASFVRQMHAKDPKLMILIWYPILGAGLHQVLAEMLEADRPSRYEKDEIEFPEQISPRLKGSGLIGINMPERLVN